MGRYVTSLRIPGANSPINFLVPATRGTVHLLCGENSVGKSYILNKLEALYRGVKDGSFNIETMEKDDGLNGSIALFYGKIWKQKDRCGSFHFTNTKRKEVAPSDGPVELFSSTLRFIYECAFTSADISIDTFADMSAWKERMELLKDIEAEAKICFPCPGSHPLVKQFESIVKGYRLYYQFFHEKRDEICFEFVLVSPDGYVSTQSKWSDGQKTVFYLLLNLYYQKSCFVILDEVENHMHPFFISKVLDIIRESGRQCILSTHHPHVIFSEYVDRIFYMELDESGCFPQDREPIEYRPTTRAFRRTVYDLETDFDKITNTYKLFDSRDMQLLKLSRYYQDEVELKAYRIISGMRTANAPVGVTRSSLPDKQSQMLAMNIGKRMRILDIGAGYGRIKEELEKAGKSNAEWYLYNLDLEQHKRTEERFSNNPMVHAINTYEDVTDHSVDAIILANVIHEITPPAFREILRQVERKLATDGRLYVIDMEPLLYAEHYAVPYSYSEIEELLNGNGWACDHDIMPHRFVTLYIVTAKKIGSAGEYDIEKLWESKKNKALAVYHTAENNNLSDYQKTMQAMTTVSSIDSFFAGIWK
ncbi:MAG: AAA family ATPase [Subdoligranulum sp.]|nr:AAA family ATPase [Subdoligranulum sp.]